MRFRSLAKRTQRAAGARSRGGGRVQAIPALACSGARLAPRERPSCAIRCGAGDFAGARVKVSSLAYPRGGERQVRVSPSVYGAIATTRRPHVRQVHERWTIQRLCAAAGGRAPALRPDDSPSVVSRATRCRLGRAPPPRVRRRASSAACHRCAARRPAPPTPCRSPIAPLAGAAASSPRLLLTSCPRGQ